MKNSKLRAYYWTIKRSSWIHTLRAHVSRSSLLHLSAEPETAAAPSPYDHVWIELLRWDQQREDEFIMCCVIYFLFSHVVYIPSYHISSVIPLIYLQTSIFTTQRPLIAYIKIYWINYQYYFCFKKEFKIRLNGKKFLVIQRCNFIFVLYILSLWNY